MKFENWLGQVTTGAGFATILTSFGAVEGGVLSWRQAIPILLGGLAGLIWPENSTASEAAQQAAADIEVLVASLQGSGPPRAVTEEKPLPDSR